MYIIPAALIIEYRSSVQGELDFSAFQGDHDWEILHKHCLCSHSIPTDSPCHPETIWQQLVAIVADQTNTHITLGSKGTRVINEIKYFYPVS